MAKSARKQSATSNGSVNDLAAAFRNVMREAVEEAIEPMATEMVAMEARLTKRIDTTETNMSAQFAAHKKDFTIFRREIKQDLHDFKKQYKERPKQKK